MKFWKKNLILEFCFQACPNILHTQSTVWSSKRSFWNKWTITSLAKAMVCKVLQDLVRLGVPVKVRPTIAKLLTKLNASKLRMRTMETARGQPLSPLPIMNLLPLAPMLESRMRINIMETMSINLTSLKPGTYVLYFFQFYFSIYSIFCSFIEIEIKIIPKWFEIWQLSTPLNFI